MFTLMLLSFAGTIFCEFLRFGINRKINYPQKFLPMLYIRHSGVYTIKNYVMFSIWEHALSISFDRFFSAISFLPSRAITSSRKWRLMISMIVGVARAKLNRLCSYEITGERWPYGMFHVNLRRLYAHGSNLRLNTVTFTKPVDFKVELLLFVEWNRKI